VNHTYLYTTVLRHLLCSFYFFSDSNDTKSKQDGKKDVEKK